MISLSRRQVLRCTIGGIAGATTACSNTPLTSVDHQPDEISKEQWMSSWMDSTRAVDGTLHLSRFADPTYYLTEPIRWIPNPGQEDYTAVTVPVGFVTDLASIPRVFFSLLRPDGVYTYPAIIHDYLYWVQDRTREEADQIFKFGMQDFDVNTATIVAISAAIKSFGSIAWNSNAKAKRQGEMRMLKQFPSDPTIRWEEWKAEDNVFAS